MIQRPTQYLLRIGAFLTVIVALAGLLFPALFSAFMANAALNGLILGVLIIAIGFAIRELLKLNPEADWLDRLQRDDLQSYSARPVLLAPLARAMDNKLDGVRLTPSAMRSLLEGIAARLHESRELSRYAIGLLVFLGLLGTFWGLLMTIGSISSVVSGLDVGAGDIGAVFGELKAGLEAPLAGMSTAFSSSLFGLAGSLILGFVDLQAGQAQNRFYTDLEDWLAENVDMNSDSELGATHEGSVPTAYLAALIEQNSEGLEKLTQVVKQSETDRRVTNEALSILSENLNTLTERLANENTLLQELGKLQADTTPVLASISQGMGDGQFGLDTESQENLRQMNTALSRLLDDNIIGRGELLEGLREELRLLSKTVAISAERQAELHGQMAEAVINYEQLRLSQAHATSVTTPAPVETQPVPPAPPAAQPAASPATAPTTAANLSVKPGAKEPEPEPDTKDDLATGGTMPDWLAPRKPSQER
ncbi:MAG: flagellar motor protein MotA [Pseudomonadota bacterium]